MYYMYIYTHTCIFTNMYPYVVLRPVFPLPQLDWSPGDAWPFCLQAICSISDVQPHIRTLFASFSDVQPRICWVFLRHV